jgi:PilZ domain
MLPIRQRASARHRAGVLTALVTGDGKFICFGAIQNVSAGGAKLKLIKEIELPDSFVMILSSTAGPRRNCKKVWQTKNDVGVRFVPIEEEKKMT